MDGALITPPPPQLPPQIYIWSNEVLKEDSIAFILQYTLYQYENICLPVFKVTNSRAKYELTLKNYIVSLSHVVFDMLPSSTSRTTWRPGSDLFTITCLSQVK